MEVTMTGKVRGQVRIMQTAEEFLTPNSSSILGATYYPASKVLRIRYKDRNGKLSSTYDYNGVSESTWGEFRKAESVGKFVNAILKGKFEALKVA